jgi:polyphosphate kinase
VTPKSKFQNSDAKFPYLPKEISWMSFNERILKEARDVNVPLLERIKFMGIFSSNQDEFFRVRVALLTRLVEYGEGLADEYGGPAEDILKQVQLKAMSQNKLFEETYQDILAELAQRNIYIINERQLTEEQKTFVRSYFRRFVRPKLMPIMLDQVGPLENLKDQSIYLALSLTKKKDPKVKKYSLIELPQELPSRFVELPRDRNDQYLMLVDDVVRFGLNDIFGAFGFKSYEAYTIKLTRDAELDMDHDMWDSFPKKIAKSLKQRKGGMPVRFIYDAAMPEALLALLTKKLRLGKSAILLAGGRYHNFRDFMSFPNLNTKGLQYPAMEVLTHPGIDRHERLHKSVRRRDILIHCPYQNFDYIIDFLREASIDPKVQSIRLTIYRAAKNSSVLNALINAARNGKEVTVVLELQARFDEEANISWGNRLTEEGVRVIYGVPGLKVHAKLGLITRREKSESVRYAMIGTGNFNEETAKFYFDHYLLTDDKRITKDVYEIFKFYETNYRLSHFKELLVAPFDMRKKILRLIKAETKNARKKQEAWIFIKVNNLVDPGIIENLYKASQAGVKIKLIVRSMFSLVPGIPGISDNIEAIRIVDRYLEHSRIFSFCNGSKPKYYIGSADLMARNLDNRVEALTPIYDEGINAELQSILDMQWQDNVAARKIGSKGENLKREKAGAQDFRSQQGIYRYLGSWPQLIAEEEKNE